MAEQYIKYESQIRGKEHDDVAPETKKVSLYGWDSANTTKVRVKVNNDGELVTSTTGGEEAVRIDEANATTTYLGYAAIGSAEAGGVWKIKRITESGTVTSIEWADGNDSYDNIWADRAALSYS